MKKILQSLLIMLSVFFALSVTTSCKKKCKNDPPQARIINNGTADASVQIKTSFGNTVNINNVAPGTSSAYASYAAGNITFTISVAKNDYIQNVNVSNCNSYDIAIDANNQITVTNIAKE
jgi:hypothetical protein